MTRAGAHRMKPEGKQPWRAKSPLQAAAIRQTCEIPEKAPERISPG